MLVCEDTKKYKGKTFSHFENEAGDKLNDLNMVMELIIVFDDGSKIKMAQDWRGGECYFSQYEL